MGNAAAMIAPAEVTNALATAPGLEHPLLIGRAPYDLIVANILAGPLIGLAPTIAMALAEGGTLVVAGLLVGFGARLGNGCTSGHGVCGVSRLSIRSIAATATFLLTGAFAVLASRLFGWGV